MKKKDIIKNTHSYIVALVLLFVGLVLSVLISITLGNANIVVKDVYSVVGFKLFHLKCFQEYASGPIHDVIWLIRFPRVILAIAIGMGLSVCGAIMQAIVKNPLADPYILGISSGASLGATTAIMLGFGAMFGNNSVGIMAFIGAFGASMAVMLLANVRGNANASRLVLYGMAISAVCSSFSNFVLYITNDKMAIAEIAYWMMGSLAGAKWDKIAMIFPVIVLGVLFFWTQYRNLNLMLLGEEVSITLGTDLHKWRTIYLIISSLMIGFAVYSVGMIGFVGLIIPHVIRMFFGTDHKKLLPLSALLGAVFLIWADAFCRIILPHSELPIGILIAMIGAPCFIYLMAKKSYGFGGDRS